VPVTAPESWPVQVMGSPASVVAAASGRSTAGAGFADAAGVIADGGVTGGLARATAQPKRGLMMVPTARRPVMPDLVTPGDGGPAARWAPPWEPRMV